MKFDDHEIWGAPVRAPESTPEAAPATAPAPMPAGRLYRSAGSDPHPEAILALPQHRRATSTSTPVLRAEPVIAEASERSPITINSRIPRPATIEDPAIAEVLGGPVASPSAAEHSGFTSWFRQSSPQVRDAVEAARSEVSAAVGSGVAGLATQPLRAGGVGLFLFAVTALVGVIDAVLTDTLGIATGAALVLASAVGAWRVETSDRWSAWVLPTYALMAATLVAGQFAAGAPGFSPLGQAMLIVTTLISLAPWLAAATLAGVLVPALRARR